MHLNVPWVPEVFFLALCVYGDMTDTGNRARKTSGTQGNLNGAFSIYSNMAPRLRGIKQKKLIIPSSLGAKLEFEYKGNGLFFRVLFF